MSDVATTLQPLACYVEDRGGGSEIFVRWVESLLGLRPGGPQPWPDDDTFQLMLADSPECLEEDLRRRLESGYGARITAGVCWGWSKPRPDGTLVHDVVIGVWRRPWNLNADTALNGIPPSSLWATDSGGFEQVGCIYTAQGFEYDYSGVIIGEDLRPTNSQHLQSFADPRAAGMHHLLGRPGDAADARAPG